MRITVATVGRFKISVEHRFGQYEVYMNDRLYASCTEYEQCRDNVKEIIGDYATHYLDGVVPDLKAA